MTDSEPATPTTEPASPPSELPALAPSALEGRASSLLQAAFGEIGLFVVAFFAVTEAIGANWWAGTNLFVAIFLAGLLLSGMGALQLHSPDSLDHKSRLRLYRWSWRTFWIANMTILVYFVVWWARLVWLAIKAAN